MIAPTDPKPPGTYYATVEGVHIRDDGRIWSEIWQAWLPIDAVDGKSLDSEALGELIKRNGRR